MLSNANLSGAYLANPVVANAIYVSPAGNDSTGNGAVGSPYQTINRAETAAGAGQTIYLRAGSYPGTVMLTKSGTSGNMITYSSYPGETATINGSSTTYYGEAILYLKSVSYVTVQNIVLQNGQGQGMKVENCSYVTISGTILHDTVLGGYVLSGNNLTLTNNELYNACTTNTNGSYGSGGWPGAMATELTPGGVAATNITFSGNYSHDNWGEGIAFFHADTAVMDGNTASNNYSMDIYCNESKNLQVTNNTVSATTDNYNRSDNGHRPTGIGFASEQGQVAPTNIIVNNNTVGSGLYAGIVKFTNGYGPVTQSPNPQNF